ncbi:MAG: hypothetical protein AB1705_08490 [Verrucomicrobiota bacterium]
MGCCLENDPPPPPNFAAATREAVIADMETLGDRRRLDAAARLGTTGRVQVGSTGGVPDYKEYDFTGLGDADIAAVNADKFASAILDIQKKYGAEFTAEALKQLEQADPEGVAARKQLFEKIQTQIGEDRERPLADELQRQIQAELEAGGKLDEQSAREFTQAVRRGQAARGNMLGDAATFQEAAEVGNQAEARRTARQQKALAFLTSGATPEDVTYRKDQQDMANLGAFLSGATPQAQFSQLSGAQNGAAPFVAGPAGPTVNPNAQNLGYGAEAQRYGAFTNWYSQQVNPWVAGITLVNNTISAVRGGGQTSASGGGSSGGGGGGCC